MTDKKSERYVSVDERLGLVDKRPGWIQKLEVAAFLGGFIMLMMVCWLPVELLELRTPIAKIFFGLLPFAIVIYWNVKIEEKRTKEFQDDWKRQFGKPEKKRTDKC